MMNFLWNRKASLARGVVKKSACRYFDSTCRMSNSPFSTCSRRKWWRTSMCLEFESITGLTAISIAPMLSSTPWVHGSPKSGTRKRHTDRRKSASSSKPSAIATHSASLEESAVHFCVLEINWTAARPQVTATPEADYLFVSFGGIGCARVNHWL